MATTYTFIRDNNRIKVIQYLFKDGNYYIPDRRSKLCFIIKLNELKLFKNLYKIYLLSVILTENISTLTFAKNNDIYKFKNNMWCISSKQIFIENKYRKMISNNYIINYGFSKYPVNIDDYDNDDEIDNNSLDLNNEEKIKYYKNVYENGNLFFSNSLNSYYKNEFKGMNNELLELKKYFLKYRILTMYSKRIKRFINDNEDIYDKINYYLLK